MQPVRERRRLRNRYLVGFDLIGAAGSLFLAYSGRFESWSWPLEHAESFLRFLPIAIAVKLVSYHKAGLYQRLWRHAGIAEMERITIGSGIAALLTILLGVWLLPAVGYLNVRVPTSVALIDAILAPIVVAAPRLLIRWLSQRSARRAFGPVRRVLIAGAGSAGELIARELRAHPDGELMPVGFVDDDSLKHGLTMCGLPVLGPIDRLVDLRERYRVDELIIAMPSAPGTVIRSIMTEAQAAGLRARTIPSMFEILSGRIRVSALRPVRIEDLLRRDPVRIDLDRVATLIEGTTVLVTGAGGSIGSELCRQIAGLGPGRLLLLGHGENSIFQIAREIAERFPATTIVPLIADVRDRERLAQIFAAHRPNLVLHAAAHKHVPLMEANVAEAVANNVGGTQNLVDMSVEFGVDRFVMISTDKAVHPTNIMGATKRVAEQVVQGAAQLYGKNFIAVRFGNVLGSRGSVVPIFLRQIEAGGPVSVTHPEMRRYFMTIPEAVQLVLQAAVLGSGGEVFVLDMGQPVRIVDLATDLIRLSGLEVGRDIEIQFSGIRPGEKLYEELFFGKEQAEATDHPKLLRARQVELPVGVSTVAQDLIVAAREGGAEGDLRSLLRRLVPDFHPEDSAHRRPPDRARPRDRTVALEREAAADGREVDPA